MTEGLLLGIIRNGEIRPRGDYDTTPEPVEVELSIVRGVDANTTSVTASVPAILEEADALLGWIMILEGTMDIAESEVFIVDTLPMLAAPAA